MKFIIDCPINKFDRCKAVIYRELRKRSNVDPSKLFVESLQSNVGKDRFLVKHSSNELEVEYITHEQEKVIRKTALMMGKEFK